MVSRHKMIQYLPSVNRFSGMRLEDLLGEIPALCKDQHEGHSLVWILADLVLLTQPLPLKETQPFPWCTDSWSNIFMHSIDM